MSKPRGLFVYTSDNGQNYNVGLDATMAAAGGFAAAAAGAVSNRPINMKMRYVLLRDPATGRERKLYISTSVNAIYTGATPTVTVETFNGVAAAATVFGVAGRVGEKFYSRT